MSSYVLITLDTTSPHITVRHPISTIKENILEIFVNSDEVLSTYQDIYTIDSEGHKRNYTFEKIDDYTLAGYIGFHDYPSGVATLYVRTADNVLNLSNVSISSIFIDCSSYEIHAYASVKIRDSKSCIMVRESNIYVSIRHPSVRLKRHLGSSCFVYRYSKAEVKPDE